MGGNEDSGGNIAQKPRSDKRRNHKQSKSDGGSHHHRRRNNFKTNTHKSRNNRPLRSRNQISHDELSNSLQEISTSRNLIESSEGIQKRRNVMKRLESMLCAWSDSLVPATSYAEMLTSSHTSSKFHQPTLLSFGSYRLGVHTPDADVDCLVLAPPHIQRHDFFDSWITELKKAKVDDLHPVSTAYTPVVKFSMSGIKIDMIFARMSTVQSNRFADHKMRLEQQDVSNGQEEGKDDGDLFDETIAELVVSDEMLIGLDETSVRCVNGVRVSQYLLATVGTHPTQLENFRLTLRIVKEWARVRGLYSNVLGFLGGVNWAILVCQVCKENPDAKPSVLLNSFFRTFANWSFPHPVFLAKQQNHPIKGVSSYPVWDPINNFRDAKHLMPIITPCYPSMNSSYNVGEPQLRRIQDELRRATKISHDVCFGRKTWSDLFKGNDFFRHHANYLQVDIISTQEDDFREWFGLCEARMRILIAGLENPNFGTQAYPFAKFFTRKEADGKHVSSFFIALRFADNLERADLGPLVMDYLQIVNSWEGRKESMDLKLHMVNRENLPSFAIEGEREEKENKTDDISTSPGEPGNPEDVSSRKQIAQESPPRSAKKKIEAEQVDSGTPSMFISPLKRAKIG